MTKLIGICGGSGSGKTTLAKSLVESLNRSASLLSMDNYYLTIERQVLDKNGVVNFDLPTALDTDLFIEDLKQLKAGKAITVKEYIFNNSNALEQQLSISSNEYIICEGIFLMSSEELQSTFDILIFIEADINVMFQRRLERDTAQRGINEEMISYQWGNHFLPAYTEFVLPHKRRANYIVNGNEYFNISEVLKWIK